MHKQNPQKLNIFRLIILIILLGASVLMLIIAVQQWQKRLFPPPENVLYVAPKRSPLIIVYGDSRTGHDAHRDIIDEIVAIDPDYVFHTGDLVNNGELQEDWDVFLDITADLRSNTTLYPALGNHERNSDLYYNLFDLPNNEQWYSVDIDSIRFVVLDTYADIGKDSEQYNWLIGDMENKNYKYLVGVFHSPPYSVSKHGEDRELINELVPILEKYKFDVVFNGHEHNYQRNNVNGIYYIVTGGGGAPLYGQETQADYNEVFLQSYNFCAVQIQEGELQITVYDEDSQVIDKITI